MDLSFAHIQSQFHEKRFRVDAKYSVKWLIVFWKSVDRLVLDLSADKRYAVRRFYSWLYNGNAFFQSVFDLPLLRFSLKSTNISTQELQISLLLNKAR